MFGFDLVFSVGYLVPVLMFLLLLWIVVFVDHQDQCIPNHLVVLVLLFGLIGHTGLDPNMEAAVPQAVIGVLVGMAGMFPGYLIGSTGAGDVKLMGASGALLGPQGALFALLFCYLMGGAMAGAVAFRSHLQGKQGPGSRYLGMVQSFVTTGRVAYVHPSEEEFMGQRFPFAFPIAAGVTLTLAIQLYY